MKLYTKQELVELIGQVFKQGWHKSVKQTPDMRNDGAVGNTLEALLGLKENNLPIPNAAEWELKGQRSHTTSLVTLKHIEPSPSAVGLVSNLLLPYYGWKHKLAGKKYPSTEMSFRSTTSATDCTSRGFKIVVDKKLGKLRFVFDAAKVQQDEPTVASWLKSVKQKVGPGQLSPEPYWGFADLEHLIGSKIANCFYVLADAKVEEKQEWFLYRELYILSGFSFGRFITCIEHGAVLVDFDARTGHNHGTKFRIRQGHWRELYSNVERVI